MTSTVGGITLINISVSWGVIAPWYGGGLVLSWRTFVWEAA